MEARISRAGDITIVSLQGYLNFEATAPFRNTCFGSLANKKIIFDLRNLNFVGSSGLTSFVEILKDFKNHNNLPVKFCGLSNEFRRLFWASEMANIEIYEDATSAHASFYQSMPALSLSYSESEVEILDVPIDPQIAGKS